MDDQDKTRETVDAREEPSSADAGGPEESPVGTAGPEEALVGLARHRAMASAFDGLIYICSPEYEITFVNERFAQRTGHDPLGRKCYEAIHRRTEVCPWCVLSRVLNGETVRREVHSPTDQRWYSVVSTPIHLPDGTVSKMAMIRDITAEKTAIDSVRRNEQMLKNILSASPMGIAYFERGKLRWTNYTMAELFGDTDQKQSLGLSAQQFYASIEEYKRVQKILFENLAKGKQARTDATFRRKDGTTFEGFLTMSAPDPSDPWKGTVATIIDISDKKRAENELRESEERHRLLTENSLTGIYIHQDGCFVYGNERLCEILGYSFEELKAKHFWEVVHPDDRELVRQRGMARSRGEAAIPQYEFRIVTRSGETKWLELLATTIIYRGRTANMGNIEDISDRKRAEEALRESESRYRLLVENAPLGIMSLDVDGRISGYNNRILEMLDIVPGEPPDTLNLLTYGPLTRAGISERIRTCLKSEEPTVSEHPYTLEDGGQLFLRLHLTPTRDSSGQISGTQALVEDVTQRRLAEVELRDSEQRYRSLFEHSPISQWEEDFSGAKAYLDGLRRLGIENFEQHFGTNPQALQDCISRIRVVDVNEATVELYSAAGKEEVLSAVGASFSEESAQALKEIILAVARGETEYEIETTVRTLKGAVRDIHLKLSVVPGYEQTCSKVLVSIVDITEMKRAELALRESEEKYRMVVDNASDAIFVAQAKALKFVNPKTEELTGYTGKELTSAPYLSFVHPDDREAVALRRTSSLTGRPSADAYTFRIIDKHGSTKWAETHPISITWEGRPATLNFTRDITEKRKLERELLKVAKLESIGILAGGIAHDFNNILTAILGNISIARLYSRSEEKVFDRLTEAEKACLRAQGLTQQLLTFSKGGAPIKKVSDISSLIEDSSRFALIGSNVRCEFSIEAGLWPVEVDEGQIGQVINNLIINADHAMPEAGLIHVLAQNVTVPETPSLPLNPGRYVHISIRDQGCGIPRELLSQVFDPYFTTKQKGSGLGLATSYSIIKNHGGLITVDSELGIGTVFHIYLPADLQREPEQPETVEQAISGHGKVLLMDDDDSIRLLAGEMLSMMGYEILTARDGAEAIELYRTAMKSDRPFNAVILDLTVPGGMGGKETIERLTRIDPKVKAIVSSGYSNDPIMADHEAYGFVGVVAKPYTTKQLTETLCRIIALSHP